jgi:hypothetical protein
VLHKCLRDCRDRNLGDAIMTFLKACLLHQDLDGRLKLSSQSSGDVVVA